jgi:hypothetical protein
MERASSEWLTQPAPRHIRLGFDYAAASATCYQFRRRGGLFVQGLAQFSSPTIHRNTPQGIYTRLLSHASGRRSGDQFCVYVADRLVLPTLSPENIAAIASGRQRCSRLNRTRGALYLVTARNLISGRL